MWTKEEKPNSSVMRKHLATKGKFHKRERKKENLLDTKVLELKTEPILESLFLLETCFSNGVNSIRERLLISGELVQAITMVTEGRV